MKIINPHVQKIKFTPNSRNTRKLHKGTSQSNCLKPMIKRKSQNQLKKKNTYLQKNKYKDSKLLIRNAASQETVEQNLKCIERKN